MGGRGLGVGSIVVSYETPDGRFSVIPDGLNFVKEQICRSSPEICGNDKSATGSLAWSTSENLDQ